MKTLNFTINGLLFISLFACQTNNERDIDSLNVKDTIEKSKVYTDSIEKSNSLILQNNHSNNIIGIWKLEGDDNPTFEMKKDIIFYIDQGESYRYQIVKDSIYIYYTDWVYKGKFEVDNNLLIIDDGRNISKYLREKE